MKNTLGLLIQFLLLVRFVVGNTESFLLSVPYYFDINSHPQLLSEDDALNRHIATLNASHSLLENYPIELIETRHNGLNVSNIIAIRDYDSFSKPKKQLLVKLNNYGDTSFASRDLLYVKLCWPATFAFDFRVSHRFIAARDFLELGQAGDEDVLDMYVVVEYEFIGETSDASRYLSENDEVVFQLYVTKLPARWLPIPIELYGFVVYFVDVTILLVSLVVPWMYGYIFS